MGYDILGNYITDDLDQYDTPIQNQKSKDQYDIAKSVQPPGPVAPPSTATPNAWDDNSPLPSTVSGPAVPATPNYGVKDTSTWEDKSAQPVTPPAQGTVAAKAAPPQPDYNTYTAQNESGNNPNIGYHDLSKGSAYGTYGLTAAAYKDIQELNPMFKDRPITSLTPDEQKAANETYAAVLSKQLQAQGVDPSEANIRLAHFMGAKGAADYLKTGAVSPQAAAANGGVDKVKEIAQGRLAGNGAPASGAANSHATQFVQATQNPKDLSTIRNDENIPVGFRQAAADQDFENLKMQRDTQLAQQKLDKTMKSGNWLELAKELNKQSEEGSIYKAMFYQKAGLADLAKQEQQKLGVGRTWQTVDLGNGKQAAVQVGADGAPIKGYTADGAMDPDQLAQAMSQTSMGNMSKAETSKSLYQDNQGNAWTMTTVPGRANPIWVNNTTGQRSITAPQGIHPISQISMDQKSNGSLLTKMLKANADANAVGAPPLYTDQEIAEVRSRASTPNSIPMAQAQDNRQEARPPVVAPQMPQQGAVAPGQAPQQAPQQQAPQQAPVTPPPAEIDNSPAAKIARYEMPMPSASRNSPADIAIRNQVYKLNPNYDGQKYKENSEIVKNFADSSKPAAKSVVALKTAANHIDDMLPVIDNLQNGKYPTANEIVNAFKKFTGDANVTNMEAIGPAVGSEIMKSFNPMMGSESERKHVADAFSAARSPEQLKEAVKMYEGLMVGKLKPLKDDYERTGRKDFWSNIIKDDNVKRMYDRHEAEQNARNGVIGGQTKSGIKFKVTGDAQ